ncbi:elongation factor P [Candidatus Sumerlaeota bacterium]|nr:elongation factor P [Candidatus Sumerlaeota bacterium]
MKIKATEIRNGTRLELDGEVYEVVDFLHITPGKGRAVVRSKLKHISSGRVIERTFSSSDVLERAEIERKSMQFLYRQGDNVVFMDMATYEQVELPEEFLSDALKFMKENMEITVIWFRGKPIGVELPPKVELRVTKTVPGVKGDTVTQAMKPATLETGLEIQVPLFIEEGNVIIVDTRDGKYVERA